MKYDAYKVSIIIAAYNAEKYIDECLLSIVNSSYKNIEVIVVDDGSIDNTPALLSCYTSSDSRVIAFRKENGGASSARNFALKYCTGSLIAIVDADDFIAKDSIEILVNTFKEKQCDIALYEVFLFTNKNKVQKFKKSIGRIDLSNIEALKLSLDWDITTLGIYKRELFNNVSFYETNIHGDEFTSRKLFYNANKISLTEAKYFYRINEESVSRKFSLSKFGILNNQILIKDFLLNHNVFSQCKHAYVKQTIKLIFGCAYLFQEKKRLISDEDSESLKQLINSQIDDIKQITGISLQQLNFKETIIYILIRNKFIFWNVLKLYKSVKCILFN
ncbi:glycosyltransferase family 2 protein [Shewanella baltica]|uniref:glycosyltransferase family 2 protein n=1 Tax=Shewanella baltica TaxID=62322 RepID=UPI003D7BC306